MKEKMKFFYNKKFILSLVATLVVVFVVSVLFISYQSGQTELKSTDQLKKIVITRGWGTEQDFAGLNCLKNKKACASKATEIISNRFQLSRPYLGLGQQTIDDFNATMIKAIKAGHYQAGLETVNRYLKIYDTSFQKRWLDNKADFLAIRAISTKALALPEKDLFVANYLISGNEAKASLFIDTASSPDLGFVYLTKTDGPWRIVAGPGSYFPPEELKGVGINDSSRKNLADSANIPVFYDPASTLPLFLNKITNSINQDLKPENILLKLPYSSPDRTFTISYRVNNETLNDLTYIIKVYYQNLDQINSIKAQALSWLDINTTNIKNKVQYEEYLVSSDGGL